MDYSSNPANKKKIYPSIESQKTGEWKNNAISGHAVDLIGFDVDKDSGKDYWIIRNSWGYLANDDGYFYMYIGITGIEDDCYEILM